MMINENRQAGVDQRREAATLDDVLAAYTDAVLTGPDAAPPEGVDQALARAVEALAACAQPEVEPSAYLRRQVHRCIEETWDAMQRPWWVKVQDAVQASMRQTARQPVYAAAALLVMVALVASFVVGGGAVAVPGTAAGPVGPGFWLAVGGVAVLVVAVVVWAATRKP
jgi:hypothetical protein